MGGYGEGFKAARGTERENGEKTRGKERESGSERCDERMNEEGKD